MPPLRHFLTGQMTRLNLFTKDVGNAKKEGDGMIESESSLGGINGMKTQKNHDKYGSAVANLGMYGNFR